MNTKCSYCRNKAVRVRFIRERREYICDDKKCELKSRLKYGLVLDNIIKE